MLAKKGLAEGIKAAYTVLVSSSSVFLKFFSFLINLSLGLLRLIRRVSLSQK